MKDRVRYFDIAKGIGMICIIMGHLGNATINSFVFTFHVPIFFLISGYFLKDSTPIKDYTLKKSKQLLVPYIVTCVCTIVGVTVWDIIKNHTFENVVYNVKTFTIASIYGSGTIEYTEPFYIRQIGALWFLLALFWALIIARFFMQYKYGWIGIAIIAYIGYKTTDILWLPFSIQAGMTAALFVYIGVVAKRADLFSKKPSPIVLCGLTGVWLWCILFCGRLYMVRNYYENGLLDILGALAGSYIVILISEVIQNRTNRLSRILEFFGTNSLIMMCCHAFELNLVSWDWVWTVFGEKLQLQYYNVYIILILLKILFCTAGICAIKQISKFADGWLKEAKLRIQKLKVKFPEKKQESGRIKYWDTAKGFAIMIMILGHTDLPGYLRIMIFSFHMPLFMIVNGYFIKNYDIKRTLKRSARTLLVPYVVTCFLSAVIFAYLGRDTGDVWSLFIYKIRAMIGGMSKMSTRFWSFDSVWLVWFVACLFVARNMYVILMKILERYEPAVRIAAIAVLASLGGLIGLRYAFLPWSLDVAMVALIFIAFGNWMRKSDFLNKNYWYTFAIPAAVWIYFVRMGIHIELATRSYPLGVLCIIEAIAGSVMVISLSKFLSRFTLLTDIMSWIGRNSMLILAIHCLELMYFNWDEKVYAYLPFTVNWFRIFIIKSIVILLITALINFFRKILKETVSGLIDRGSSGNYN